MQNGAEPSRPAPAAVPRAVRPTRQRAAGPRGCAPQLRVRHSLTAANRALVNDKRRHRSNWVCCHRLRVSDRLAARTEPPAAADLTGELSPRTPMRPAPRLQARVGVLSQGSRVAPIEGFRGVSDQSSGKANNDACSHHQQHHQCQHQHQHEPQRQHDLYH